MLLDKPDLDDRDCDPVAAHEWELQFILPNIELSVGTTFESDYVAIVPFNDHRLKVIQDKSKSARVLINGFVTPFYPEIKVSASALITRTDAPEAVRSGTALAAFRNCVAACVNLHTWTHRPRGDGNSKIGYSDCFEFHPFISGKCDSILVDSAVVLGYYDPDREFIATPSSHLDTPFSEKAEFDCYLLERLMVAWNLRYIDNVTTHLSERVFRSLEVAAIANRVPVGNLRSIFDYGVHATLWVSAIEILAHPEKGYINRKVVEGVIKNVHWMDVSLGELANRMYSQLYDARNAFAHGNDIVEDTFIVHKSKNRKDRAITVFELAPILYYLILSSEFGHQNNIEGDDQIESLSQRCIERYLDRLRGVIN